MSGRGKRLEAIVRKAAKSLSDRQIARIHRWAEAKETKLIPSRCRCGNVSSTLAVIHTEAPGADFWGYTVAGRVILIECKENGTASLPIGGTGLKPHQAAALLEAHRAGGIALLAWYRKDEIAVIDVDLIRSLTKDRRSIPWKEIPPQYIHRDDEIDSLFTPYLRASSEWRP
jgi:penicillin-binding protein-related factor A (putative recombinase)